jgi:hypothetical protein
MLRESNSPDDVRLALQLADEGRITIAQLVASADTRPRSGSAANEEPPHNEMLSRESFTFFARALTDRLAGRAK